MFYSRTQKTNECQLWGSVKTPSRDDNMKWTKKRLLDAIRGGMKVHLGQHYRYHSNDVEKYGIVVPNVYTIRYGNIPELAELTEEIYDILTNYDQRRIINHMNAYANYFEHTYKRRLAAYRMSRNALDIQDAN